MSWFYWDIEPILDLLLLGFFLNKTSHVPTGLIFNISGHTQNILLILSLKSSGDSSASLSKTVPRHLPDFFAEILL